jgi:hypothetical protein
MEPMDSMEPMEHVCVEQQPNTIHIYIDYREYKLINEIFHDKKINWQIKSSTFSSTKRSNCLCKPAV